MVEMYATVSTESKDGLTRNNESKIQMQRVVTSCENNNLFNS